MRKTMATSISMAFLSRHEKKNRLMLPCTCILVSLALLIVPGSGFSPLLSFSGRTPSVSSSSSSASAVNKYGYSTPFRATSSTQLFVHSLPSSSLGAVSVDSSSLMNFFLESLISNGVPCFFTIVVIAFAAKALFGRDKHRRDEYEDDDDELFENSNSPVAALYRDLYGDQQQQPSKTGAQGMLRRLFGGNPNDDDALNLPQNVGVPQQQYLKFTHINRKLDSYQYSMTAATQSRAQAAANFRARSFERALGKALSATLSSPYQWQQLQKLEKDLLKKSAPLLEDLRAEQTQLALLAMDAAVYKLDPAAATTKTPLLEGEGDNTTDVAASSTTTSSSSALVVKSSTKSKIKRSKSNKRNMKPSLLTVAKLQSKIQQLELVFVQQLLELVGPAQTASVRAALLGDVATRGIGNLVLNLQQRPLTALLMNNNNQHDGGGSSSMVRKPVLYVTRFPGDATASQVETLREEVTAIVRNAQPNDESLVVLQTGGGTVTGYGLAAAQLLRLKEKGHKLTIAVEQVAASGGYMMCCVADRIVASPFAVLGSIGVISDIPNVYERLKQEGIEFQTVTAGKYKRTLTPTKKVTKEDFEKTKEDVEDILLLFRDFVAQNRPQLDIDAVATGETWFGKDALDRKLCDELKTADAVLMEYVDDGFDVFEVEYKPPVEQTPLGKLFPARSSASSRSDAKERGGVMGQAIGWLARAVVAEVKDELLGTATAATTAKPLQERYMAQNDDAQKKRTEA